jgi:polysaccharide biosynthesis transport protein
MNYMVVSNMKPAPADDAASHNGPVQDDMATPVLLRLWQILSRWKWVILGIVASALVVGTIITLLMTPQYSATARIEISREQKNITKVEGIESADASRDMEFYETQYALLSARSLAERVTRVLRLADNSAFFEANGVRPEDTTIFATASNKPLSSTARQNRERLAVQLLLKHISIAPITRSRLVDISYTSASADLSAQIVNTWTQQFIESSMDRRFASTADARKFLEGRLSDLGMRLEESERELVNFASSKDIVPLGTVRSADGKTEVERTLVSSNLDALNTALAEATAARFTAESRAQQRNAGGTNVEALGNLAISGLRQKRAEVASEYAKMLVQFEPGYPAANALAQQLRTLDASIAREESRVMSSRSAEYSEALRRETQLKAKVDELKQSLDRQHRDSIQYNIYQREADTNRQLYDSLLQRYKEIGVAGVAANNISVVDIARIPNRPSGPSFVINLALALLGGFALSAAAVLGLEQMDEGLRNPADVARLLQLPLLGSVPNQVGTTPIEAMADTKSEISESYLSIRSNLAFSTDHGVPRTLMVTSSRPAEGKSTSAFSIATILGRTGKRVLLVDADMRSPSVHGFVGGQNAKGLSNYLAGDNDWEALVQQTTLKGLGIIAAGPTPPSAAELLSSERMRQLIAHLKEHFDHVIVDAPPILGLADAPLLTRAVEGCIFVIEAGGVAVRGLRSALERLHLVHASVFGVILTKLDANHAGYGYGYGYGYRYGGDGAAVTGL